MTKVVVVDGTYELFRAYFGAPPARGRRGREVGATRGLVRSLLSLLRGGATHVACAFDHVVESFRNELFQGYKTGAEIPAELYAQFELAEQAAIALGLTTWPMVEFEADDALATAAGKLAENLAVTQVVIASPDKDLAQCVDGRRVVLWDRRRNLELDDESVLEKFGVVPESIPDWLALVGDSADGIPGIPRWGAKSAATVLRRYLHLDAIPAAVAEWDVKVRGAKTLAENLARQRADALLYRQLATLRRDVPIDVDPAQLIWHGPRSEALEEVLRELDDKRLPGLVEAAINEVLA